MLLYPLLSNCSRLLRLKPIKDHYVTLVKFPNRNNEFALKLLKFKEDRIEYQKIKIDNRSLYFDFRSKLLTIKQNQEQMIAVAGLVGNSTNKFTKSLGNISFLEREDYSSEIESKETSSLPVKSKGSPFYTVPKVLNYNAKPVKKDNITKKNFKYNSSNKNKESVINRNSKFIKKESDDDLVSEDKSSDYESIDIINNAHKTLFKSQKDAQKLNINKLNIKKVQPQQIRQIRSDSSMEIEINSHVIEKVTVEEVSGKYFMLRNENVCLTYFMKSFVFMPCIKNSSQLFTLEDEEDVNPGKVYKSLEEYDMNEYRDLVDSYAVDSDRRERIKSDRIKNVEIRADPMRKIKRKPKNVQKINNFKKPEILKPGIKENIEIGNGNKEFNYDNKIKELEDMKNNILLKKSTNLHINPFSENKRGLSIDSGQNFREEEENQLSQITLPENFLGNLLSGKDRSSIESTEDFLQKIVENLENSENNNSTKNNNLDDIDCI